MPSDEYNIKHLTRRVDELQAWRDAAVRKDATARERARTITDAFPRTQMDFWCAVCIKDFTGTAWKQVRHFPTSAHAPTAWYSGICPEGHQNIRYITDKLSDPYYVFSEQVRRQRIEHADAMLTPDDPRFRLVYPDKWRALEQAREDHARAVDNRRRRG